MSMNHIIDQMQSLLVETEKLILLNQAILNELYGPLPEGKDDDRSLAMISPQGLVDTTQHLTRELDKALCRLLDQQSRIAQAINPKLTEASNALASKSSFF